MAREHRPHSVKLKTSIIPSFLRSRFAASHHVVAPPLPQFSVKRLFFCLHYPDIGDHVQLSDVEASTIAAPTESGGAQFDFDARTNNFAAVNTYYHCD